MNHRFFEEWLFADQPLEPDQAHELHVHLQSCESCRRLKSNWMAIDNLFHRADHVSPEAGFTTRWLYNVALENQERQRRQAWRALVLFGGAAVLSFILLISQALIWIESPLDILFLGFSRLAELVSYADWARDFLLTLLRTMPGLLPLPAWILVAGFLSLISVLWLVTYQHVTSARRIRA